MKLRKLQSEWNFQQQLVKTKLKEIILLGIKREIKKRMNYNPSSIAIRVFLVNMNFPERKMEKIKFFYLIKMVSN